MWRTYDRTAQVIVRLTETEKAAWKEAAQRDPWWGMSTMIRTLVERYLASQKPTPPPKAKRRRR